MAMIPKPASIPSLRPGCRSPPRVTVKPASPITVLTPLSGQASRRSGGRFAERQQHAALDVPALQGGAGEQRPHARAGGGGDDRRFGCRSPVKFAGRAP